MKQIRLVKQLFFNVLCEFAKGRVDLVDGNMLVRLLVENGFEPWVKKVEWDL